jgi:hydroxycarboxylate dehydrogenase B
MPVFMPGPLQAVVRHIVQRMGSSPEEADVVADHLVRANLAGHDSHGVGMLASYIRILHAGLLVPNQTLQTVLEEAALLVLDAQRGFGQPMATEAVRRAIARARQMGACVLALRNSAHIGRIGTYGEQCAREGMAFTAFVNVADDPPWQAPYGSRDPSLGTNPFCVAVPGAANGPAMLLDMATTTIAFGKARVAHNRGVKVPEGALIDVDGQPTTDPEALVARHEGALLAFGRHKGSGLAVMCEIMAGALAGGLRADQGKRGGIVNSMLAFVVDVSRLGDPASMAEHFAAVGAHIKAARAAPGFDEILVPGEPERRQAEQRGARGIEVDETSWAQICQAAASIGVTAADIGERLAA